MRAFAGVRSLKTRTSIVSALIALCLSGGLAAQTDGRADLAIRGVTVLDPEDGSVVDGQTLLIDGSEILDVGADGAVEIPEGVRVVEAAGMYVLPGLWDLHTHLSLADVHAPALMVTQGVTGARDLGAIPEQVEGLREQILSGDVLGPRIVRAGPTLNGAPNAPHHRVIATPEAAAAAVEELQRAGVDVLKTHNATEREPYFALLEAASEAGIDVVGHIPVTVDPIEACEAGHASVEHIVTVFEGVYMTAHGSEMAGFQAMGSWLENDAVRLVDCFARMGTLFVPTLRAYQYRAHRAALYDAPPEGWSYLSAEGRADFRAARVPTDTDRNPIVIRFREQLVEIGQRLSLMLYEAGAPIGTGTDIAGAGLVPGFSVHREIELLAEAGLPPHAAIWAAARGPGDNASGDPLTGRIESGAPADLLLLRSNPFERIEALSSIDSVILRGELLDRPALDAVLAEMREP